MKHARILSVSALLSMLAPLFTSSLAFAYDSQSDGSDGAFNPQSDVTIDLRLAADGHWQDTPGTGNGVYDSTQWAVVFKYTTINIPAGVNVRFTNHVKNPPVVWLASGSVTIAGKVILNGEDGVPALIRFAAGGPGGFSGGRAGIAGFPRISGLGPGGGAPYSGEGGGGYGTQGVGPNAGLTYGTAFITPLIGGSGGSGYFGPTASGGGGGGGAILIAASGVITISNTGIIESHGGYSPNGYSGSGGAIRIIADQIDGSGLLDVTNGVSTTQGRGRLRVETLANNWELSAPPWASIGLPGPIFPESTAPRLRATLVHGKSVPLDPLAGMMSEELLFNSTQPVTIQIEANNVPPGQVVEVKIVSETSNAAIVLSTPLSGSVALSTATATHDFPKGRSEIQLRVVIP